MKQQSPSSLLFETKSDYILCLFSEKMTEFLPTVEKRKQLIDFFFQSEPPDSIEWINLLEGHPDDELPMYTIKNTLGDTILFWPSMKDNDRIIHLELMTERPDLTADMQLD